MLETFQYRANFPSRSMRLESFNRLIKKRNTEKLSNFPIFQSHSPRTRKGLLCALTRAIPFFLWKIGKLKENRTQNQ